MSFCTRCNFCPVLSTVPVSTGTANLELNPLIRSLEMYQSIPQISVEELALRLAGKDGSLQLIDVREPQEVAIASIQGFEVLSLSQFEQWSGSIKDRFNPQVETLILCHHGVRSAQMCQWLQNIGFSNVKNIAGGIDAYSCLVDSTVPRY